MRVAATFLQASDLHIGHVLADGNAPLPLFAPIHRIFDGQYGHSYDAVLQLEAFWRREAKPRDASLFVTGDLTAHGDPAHFDLADELLRDFWRTPTFLGLGVRDWVDRAIPGNHDHWPGPWILGLPNAALQTLFPSLPYDISFQPKDCPRAIRVLGVDTDSMVSPFGADRLFARGRCTDQFDQLDQELDAAPGDAGNEVRVLLLHHSPSHEPWIGRLSSASRARFVRFVRDHDIRVVLTGHTHEPLANTLDNLGLPDVLEACCGTTTQRTALPPGMHAPFRQGHLATVNTLVWHELLEDDRGDLTWRSRVYPRHPVDGFRWAAMPDGSSRQGSVAL